LIVLGVGLIVTETVVPGYGALGIGGVAALVLGSILLLDVDVPGYGVSRGLIFGIAASTGIAMVLILRMATRARSRPVSTGIGELLGHRAIACGGFQERGSVRIRGETWQATSAAPVQAGQALIVESIEGLTLKVKPE
jgi:membrane-bound serine protease (ClpP class)